MAELTSAFSMAKPGNALRLSVTGPGLGGGGGRGLSVRLFVMGPGGRGVGGQAGDPDGDP